MVCDGVSSAMTHYANFIANLLSLNVAVELLILFRDRDIFICSLFCCLCVCVCVCVCLCMYVSVYVGGGLRDRVKMEI